eukprot:scaffold4492_cov81-Skeletonema_menzelii.AAC.3
MHLPNFLTQRLTTTNNTADAAATGAAWRSNNNAEEAEPAAATTAAAAATTNSQTSRSQRLTTTNNTAVAAATGASRAARRSNNAEEAAETTATTTTTAATMNSQTSRSQRLTANNTAEAASSSARRSNNAGETAEITTVTAAAATMNSQTSRLSSQSSILEGSQTTVSSNTGALSTLPIVAPRETRDWTESECLLLAQSWVFVSTSSITGTDQKGDSMWSQIRQDYIRRVRLAKVQHPKLLFKPRTQKQLCNFWSTMNKAMNKFAGICRQHPPTSGMNDMDTYYEKMLILYSQQKLPGYPAHFRKYLKAYMHVKQQPKWMEKAKKRPSATGDKNDQESQPKRKRPVGRDRAKLEKKVKEAGKDARTTSDEKWKTVEGHLSKLARTYKSIEDAVVMGNAPEPYRTQYFEAMAKAKLASLRQSESDVEMLDPSAGKGEEEQREDQNNSRIGEGDVGQDEEECSDDSVVVVDDDEERKDDQSDDDDSFADPQEVRRAVAAAKLHDPHAVPFFDLHPKEGMDVYLTDVFNELPAQVGTTVVTSSEDDMKAVDERLKSLKVKARVYKLDPKSCHSKYDVTNVDNAPVLAVLLNEYANVDSNNPAEIMAFNYVLEQIDVEDQGGGDEVWNNACEQMDAMNAKENLN